MSKFNFKKIIVTIATLAALAGAIKWSENYKADINFRKLPKQQQVYVDSLMQSGSINEGIKRKKVQRFNEEKQKKETVDALIFDCSECKKRIEVTKKMK